MQLSPSRPMTISIPRLRAAFDGRVLAPGDAGYDQARTLFYGGIDRYPAVIVRPVNASEVAQVVLLARERGLELAVRSGGHSPAGHSTTQGGIVLDLTAMKALHLDVEGRTAWAQARLTAGEYTTAAGAHGLATGFGDTGSVGLGGQLLHADAHTHPDLFWALRGGGGNFGVATRLQYRLHPVAQVVGGLLVLPATPQVLTGLVAEAQAAPDELSTIANVLPAPPLPAIPASQHGRLVVMATLCYAGDVAAGQRAVAPLRALASPIADLVRPLPYPAIYPPDEQGDHPTAVAHTMFVDRVDHQVAATIVEYLQASDAPVRVAQLRVLGGAMARVPAQATAFAHRASKIMVNVAAFSQGPADRAVRQAWVGDFAAALRQDDPGAYVGFLGEEGPARVRQAYPGPTWQRLAAIVTRRGDCRLEAAGESALHPLPPSTIAAVDHPPAHLAAILRPCDAPSSSPCAPPASKPGH